MNLEKFTERSREFIQSAQSDALASEHQRILPQHLLKVILNDEQEFAKNLLKKVSVDLRQLLAELDLSLKKVPRIKSVNSQMFFDTQTLRVLEKAQKLAKENSDKFVSVERILCALASVKSDAKNILLSYFYLRGLFVCAPTLTVLLPCWLCFVTLVRLPAKFLVNFSIGISLFLFFSVDKIEDLYIFIL